MEMVGYIARILSIKKDTAKALFVLQYCLVVLAPVLMAGACYVIFVSLVGTLDVSGRVGELRKLTIW